jgi:hypothetical protein
MSLIISALHSIIPALSDIAEIIKAAGASPLGIIALIIVIAGGLGYYFFSEESARIKISMFLVLLAGAGLLVYVLYLHIPPESPPAPDGRIPSTNPGPTPVVTTEVEVEILDHTLREAIKRLAKSDNNSTVSFDGCPKKFLNSVINKGKIKGRDTADLIKQLQNRIKTDQPSWSYTVAASQERAVYEITCTK